MTTTEYINVPKSLQNLEDEISKQNFEAVRDLINHAAAEGVGESQQQRHIYAWKTVLKKFAPEDFQIRGASEQGLKTLVAALNRSDYAEATKHKFRCAIKKLYKVENRGQAPDKIQFFSVHKNNKPTSVSREDLFTKDELKRLLRNFTSTRDLESKLDWYIEQLEDLYRRFGSGQKEEKENLKTKIEDFYTELRREKRNQWRDKIELEMELREVERSLEEVEDEDSL